MKCVDLGKHLGTEKDAGKGRDRMEWRIWSRETAFEELPCQLRVPTVLD